MTWMSSDEEEEEVPAAAACHEDQEGQRKKKAASKRFENAIEAWLQEYGGLLRHQFETEEQQIGKVSTCFVFGHHRTATIC